MIKIPNPHAFISYASEDRRRVVPIAKKLEALGFSIWIDQSRLIGGQNFVRAIEEAFHQAEVILIFLSRHSVKKTGFCQKEVKWAEEKLELTPEGKIAVIPVLLDINIDIPDFLRPLHYLRHCDKDFYSRLSQAVTAAGCNRLAPITASARAPKAAKSQPIYQQPKRRAPGLRHTLPAEEYLAQFIRNSDSRK